MTHKPATTMIDLLHFDNDGSFYLIVATEDGEPIQSFEFKTADARQRANDDILAMIVREGGALVFPKPN